MTPEELKLAKVKAIQAEAQQPQVQPQAMPIQQTLETQPPADLRKDVPAPDRAAMPSMPIPQATPRQTPEVDPPNARDPYRFRAQDMSAKADALEAQARPPQAPQGLGRTLLTGVSEGLQGSVHTGGFAGFKQEQRQNERQREQDLLARAKSYREESQKEELTGMTEEQRQIENRRADISAITANRPKLVFGPKGSQPFLEGPSGVSQVGQPIADDDKGYGSSPMGIYNKGTGKIETPAPTKDGKVESKAGTLGGNLAFANFDPTSGKFTHPATGEDVSAQFKPMPTTGSEGQTSVVMGRDPENPQTEVPWIVDRVNKTAYPVKAQGGGAGPTKITASAQGELTKADTEARNAQTSLQEISALVDKPSSVADQALLAKYFDAIMPTVGRRWNQAERNALAQAGTMKDRIAVFLKAAGSRELFTPDVRQEIKSIAQRELGYKTEHLNSLKNALGGAGGQGAQGAASGNKAISWKDLP